MTVRPLAAKDLKQLAADGFRGFGPMIETALVVVDSAGKPIAACSAERSAEIHMVCGQASPGEKLAALKMLHRAMGAELRALGYHDASAWIEKPRFGRRLERLFGWTKALPAWTVRF